MHYLISRCASPQWDGLMHLAFATAEDDALEPRSRCMNMQALGSQYWRPSEEARTPDARRSTTRTHAYAYAYRTRGADMDMRLWATPRVPLRLEKRHTTHDTCLPTCHDICLMSGDWDLDASSCRLSGTCHRRGKTSLPLPAICSVGLSTNVPMQHLSLSRPRASTPTSTSTSTSTPTPPLTRTRNHKLQVASYRLLTGYKIQVKTALVWHYRTPRRRRGTSNLAPRTCPRDLIITRTHRAPYAASLAAFSSSTVLLLHTHYNNARRSGRRHLPAPPDPETGRDAWNKALSLRRLPTC
ncbi:hypothetical protein OH76DRAFT_724303 [Lentinus brumalis]|uniref:Uncharacterized protein n=1 Tax=Lentinus brumalis TaxID=2498619 RepID=A0A371D521_9APHY|nr:hypothetical protein OH76DRAFT_724303 [Polyporus brumalis]